MATPNTSISGLDESQGPASSDGTLVIIVCRARHLPNRRKLDKQSPYVTLRIGTTAKKTPSHFRAGQTPEWTHEIRFQLSRDRRPLMKLDVLDETKSDPTPIGTIDIDCSVVFSNPSNEKDGRYIYDKWHDLTLNGRRAGMIYLEMTFYPSAPILPPKMTDPMSYEDVQGLNHHHMDTNPTKDLPAPPRHPSQTHKHTAADDVFVTSDSAKSSKLSFLKGSGGNSTNAFDNFNGPVKDGDSGQVSGSSSPTKRSKLINKFKSKFQSKDPIGSIWQNNNGGIKLQRSESPPISEYRMDDYGDQTGNRQHNSPRAKNGRAEYDDDFELHAPVPPPHMLNLDESETPPPVPRHGIKSNMQTSPSRRPPKDVSSPFTKPVSNTSIPFSADTIGIDDDDNVQEDGVLPTKVFLLDQQVKSLTFTGSGDSPQGHHMNPDEIDPKYYAPTPNEHLSKSQRFQNAQEGHYLGDGKWSEHSKFSPSVFDRMPLVGDENSGFENKPNVPPKIPRGLSESEYYVLEKEKYLKDVNGRRL